MNHILELIREPGKADAFIEGTVRKAKLLMEASMSLSPSESASLGRIDDLTADSFELLYQLPGVWPVILVPCHAPECQLHHRFYHRHDLLTLMQQDGIYELVQRPYMDLRHHHVNQRHLAPVPAHIHGLHPCHELQQHHSEAIHIALLGETERPVVLRVEVPGRALWPRAADVLGRGAQGRRRVRQREQPGEAEVADFDPHVPLDEDVRRGDVAVDDGRLEAEMEVLEGSGSLDGDVEADGPGEDLGLAVGAMGAVQVVGEGAVGDVVVDEEEAAGVAAVAVEADEVRVAEG